MSDESASSLVKVTGVAIVGVIAVTITVNRNITVVRICSRSMSARLMD